MPLTGGCLCGAVRYEVTGEAREVFFCYCGQCRKAQGTPFVASVPVAVTDFRLMQGADALKGFRATPSKARYFCGHCGSPIYSQVDGNNTVRIRAGTLDNRPSLQLKAHIYTADKASWYTINDPAPQYAAREPGRD
ncbi:MAG: GFA family protein [Gammaproteobacteria bacterium]|nr:GFA family protein [Gammaproteobacteria bacterium]